MAEISTSSMPVAVSNHGSAQYKFAFGAMTTLFFLWGFITVLNDILIPHLKAAFDLNYTEAMLIQFCFFGAYFLVSVPAGALVRKIGYKNGVITGLLIGSLGCLLFYPAASIHQYWLFLCALFVLASGITVLQVSANPYVAALGPAETASSRLNLAQALNSLGTTLAPHFGALLFFSATAAAATEAANADSVKIPYLFLALAMAIIAIVFFLIKLPKLEFEQQEHSDDTTQQSILSAPHAVFGAAAIFFYVGAEVAIGSFIVNYFGQADIGGLNEHQASQLLTYYWGGAMIGRFIGAAVTRVVRPQRVLAFNAVAIFILLLVTMNTDGNVAIWSVLSIGLFNSIMFPTIFSLAIDKLGSLTSRGSGLLCLAIVGGAIIPVVQGFVADIWHIQISFVVPLLCYVFILWYGLNVAKLQAKWQQNSETLDAK